MYLFRGVFCSAISAL